MTSHIFFILNEKDCLIRFRSTKFFYLKNEKINLLDWGMQISKKIRNDFIFLICLNTTLCLCNNIDYGAPIDNYPYTFETHILS